MSYNLKTARSLAQSSFIGLDPKFTSFRPKFSGVGCIMRIFPLYDPDTNSLTPIRVCDIENAAGVLCGDWTRAYPHVRLFGPTNSRPVQFIPYNPMDPVAAANNPITILYNSVLKAVDNKVAPPTWANIFSTSGANWTQKTRPSVEFTSLRYFVLGALVSINGQRQVPPLGGSPSGPFYLIQLAKSAGDELVRLAESEEIDFIDLNSQYYVQVQPVPGQRLADGSIQPNRYMVTVNTPEYFREPAHDFKPVINAIMQQKYCWDNILRVPDVRQQVALLLSSAVPLDAIVYAFTDTPLEEHIPAETLKRGKVQLQKLFGARDAMFDAPKAPEQHPSAPLPTSVTRVSPATPVPPTSVPPAPFTSSDTPEALIEKINDPELRARLTDALTKIRFGDQNAVQAQEVPPVEDAPPSNIDIDNLPENFQKLMQRTRSA